MKIGETAITMKLARAGVAVGKRYAEQAKKEAERDLQRIVISLAMIVIAAVFGVHGVAFLHAFAVAALVAMGAEPWWVLGGLLAFDWLTALILLLIARAGLLRPLMPQTRKQLAELIAFLKA